ncbi:MAG: hypothetical protein ACYS26_02830 [Planctomycetota bacterium]
MNRPTNQVRPGAHQPGLPLPQRIMRPTRLGLAARALLAGAVCSTPALAQLPPTQTDAGGENMPNLGMHDMKTNVTAAGGKLVSGAITLPVGTIPSPNSQPIGWVLSSANLYLPENAAPGDDQAALDSLYTLSSDNEYPQDLWFSNSDPSGSLDRTAVDENGDPIHFNLHWPSNSPGNKFWLTDAGISPNSPTEDLQEIADYILNSGQKDRLGEAKDILIGTNNSGALTNRAYNGFELIHINGAKRNTSYDPVTRNIEIEQLWYDNEIRASHMMMEVPRHGDYTITWKLRGLGDPGPNREFAFPIDEFSAMPMKKTANPLFWYRNNWIWKWFGAVAPTQPGFERKFSLENLFELHTGTPTDAQGNPVPTYADLIPGDPRYWLHVNRKVDMGSYVGGTGDITDQNKFHQYDLDLDGRIGGYLADGTDTGVGYDPATNADAQFNSYGNNEYAVPLFDWSQGPYNIPYFGYDSSFNTIRKGEGIDVTIRYGQGENQAGIYTWGWREHPPRINWIETYSPGQILASGAPKDWRFGHKWDEVQALGIDAIGELTPEMRLYDAFQEFADAPVTAQSVRSFYRKAGVFLDGMRDRRSLPSTATVAGFPNPNADLNLFFGNLDIWGDRDRIDVAGKDSFSENDTVTVTIYNDDNVERYFRVVDFGTTNYQYNGLDMGIFDWKPVFGFPQLAAGAWGSLFASQGFDDNYWAGTSLDGIGNPFYVDPLENDPANYWLAGTRDLKHDFDDLTGFSGPGFHSFQDGAFTVWGNNQLAGKPTGNSNIWSYSYGKPIPPKAVVTFEVEMPRSAALNNGAMYIFDPQFHFTSVYTLHPTAELVPEGLDG